MENDIKTFSSKENDIDSDEPKLKNYKWFNFKTKIIWYNLAKFLILHSIAIYHFLTFPYWQYKGLVLWVLICTYLNAVGVTAGIHRLWTHRTYKAKLPLRFVLAFLFYSTGTTSIKYWVKLHRTHHKYSDTDGDPHNIRRGFFFAHIGWLMMEKHPDVVKGGKSVDISDVLNDPAAAFFDRHFTFFTILCCFILPVFVPVYFFNQELKAAIITQWFMRWLISVHRMFSVNSFTHTFGYRPYDKSIAPSDHWAVAVFTAGEGWHNYHHSFPWDYRGAEFDNLFFSNHTTDLIKLWAKLGLAYDLKVADPELVKKVAEGRGDGSHPVYASDKGTNHDTSID